MIVMSPIEHLILDNQRKLLLGMSLLLSALEARLTAESVTAKLARELTLACDLGAREVEEVLE